MAMLKALEKLIGGVNRWLVLAAGVFLVGMVLLTCANIGLRIAWLPVRGTFELMGFFGALVTAFSLAYTQAQRGHIAVDVLINTFPPGVRRLLGLVNSAVCAVFFAVVAWQLADKAAVLRQTGELTETLRVPYYPFTYGVAAGCAMLAVVFLAEGVRSLRPSRGGRP
jgi:TRAP-type C4-dicarboxylate transport system permease small subunit